MACPMVTLGMQMGQNASNQDRRGRYTGRWLPTTAMVLGAYLAFDFFYGLYGHDEAEWSTLVKGLAFALIGWQMRFARCTSCMRRDGEDEAG